MESSSQRLSRSPSTFVVRTATSIFRGFALNSAIQYKLYNDIRGLMSVKFINTLEMFLGLARESLMIYESPVMFFDIILLKLVTKPHQITDMLNFHQIFWQVLQYLISF